MFTFDEAYDVLNSDPVCKTLLFKVHQNHRDDVKQDCCISILRTIKLYDKNKKLFDHFFKLDKFVRQVLNRTIIDHIRSMKRKIISNTKSYDFDELYTRNENKSGEELRESDFNANFTTNEYGFDVVNLRIDFQLAKEHLSEQHYQIGNFLIHAPFGFDLHYQDVANKLNVNVSAITYAKRKLKSLLA